MNLPDTVLVLGAGASNDFGLPTGPQLIEQIKHDLRGIPSQTFRAMVEEKFADNDFEDLLYSLEHKRAKTIDEYLRKAAPRTRELGKFLIGHALLKAEQQAANRPPGGRERDWLEEFVNTLMAAAVEQRRRLGVVTFNYDRLVEYQIISGLWADAVQNGCEIEKDAYPMIAIEHVHGALGSVQAHRNWCIGEFRGSLSQGRLRAAADAISIVAEPSAEPAFARAREMISNAKRILFMGFGFDSTNLERLGLLRSSKAHSRRVSATCRGLDDRTRDLVESMIGSRVEWLPDLDCLDALRSLEDPFKSLS
jgi:hypothetical protein